MKTLTQSKSFAFRLCFWSCISVAMLGISMVAHSAPSETSQGQSSQKLNNLYQVVKENPKLEKTWIEIGYLNLELDQPQKALDALPPKFTGAISQVPPMYSALKRDGKPLYEYARAGVELERTPRDIVIHHIRWTNIQWPQATLEVTCSKGTYIRVLAEDLGNALGCGAHLVGLRRTEVGHLSLEHSFTIESIQQAVHDSSNYILPVDALLQTLPHLTVDEQQAKRLEMGQRVPLNLPSIEALVRIYRATAAPHNFIGTADWRSGVLHPKRLISQAH